MIIENNTLYKDKENAIFSLSPLDIQNGRHVGLIELNSLEIDLYMNPPKTTDTIQLEAKILRDAATEDVMELTGTGAIYQIDSAARETMNEVRIKADLEGLPLTETRQWRLADNSWRPTSLDEINKLLLAYIDRKEAIWQAFNVWDNGDKSEAFTL